MPERLERAKRYRQHAAELRAMVQDWRDPATLRQIGDLARTYQRMALELERSAEADGVFRR